MRDRLRAEVRAGIGQAAVISYQLMIRFFIKARAEEIEVAAKKQ